jgi:hypothetical protein
MRWLSRAKVSCSDLIIHSGAIPHELTAENFEGFNFTPHLVYGKKDEYITEERIVTEKEKATTLFGNKTKINAFDGGHEMNHEYLKSFDYKETV